MGDGFYYLYVGIWAYVRHIRNLTSRDAYRLSFLLSPMALNTSLEVPASPSHSAVTPQAGHPASPSTRPSLEPEKTSQLDVTSAENLDDEKVSTPTQNEPPIVTAVYNLNVRKLNIKFAAICFALFLEGWNLGATGPLVPAIQKHYGVGLQSSAH